MSILQMRRPHYAMLLIISFGAMAILEWGRLAEGKGALLLTLAFWTTLIQGSVAVVAIGDIIGAKWVESAREELLASRDLLLFIAPLFLLLGLRLDLYPWMQEEGLWLNPNFFIGRNLILLILSWVCAQGFARRCLAKRTGSKEWAVAYLFIFTASQSLVAFDWVMSLVYPWFSTLLGGFYVVESLYAGFALAGTLFFLCRLAKKPAHQTDVGLLLFGFSVLWLGLFFAQYLLIWYGNLPEEVEFIVQRTSSPGYRLLCIGFLTASFLVPFTVLISRRAKSQSFTVFLVSASILLGLLLERILFILPAIPLNLGLLLVQNGLFLILWLISIQKASTK